jgi:hypothetical protein
MRFIVGKREDRIKSGIWESGIGNLIDKPAITDEIADSQIPRFQIDHDLPEPP